MFIYYSLLFAGALSIIFGIWNPNIIYRKALDAPEAVRHICSRTFIVVGLTLIIMALVLLTTLNPV
jgi:hypothetical protein